ncbi:response regulator [Rhodopseudomonas palustris]|uniref:Response regulator n=1 Tax=Rhodopseudomonas palustris TaxID=1076 RepID=A0A418VDQ2_RHOPL|nr:response regulator [Rhodopseudomonas palustris]RJF74265.1 response regulator [Rhodopseudomonas palustris]
MVDNFVKIITAIATLINSLAWPLVVAWLIWRFAPVVRDFLANISEGSVKAFGVEASAKRRAAEAIAIADLKQELPSSPATLKFLAQAQNRIRYTENITQIFPVESLRGKRILWVDDEPESNWFERSALTELGLDLHIVTDLDAALRSLAERRFDAAIIVPRHIVVAEAWKQLERQLYQRSIPVVVYDPERPHNWPEALLSPAVYSVATDASDLLVTVSGALQGLHASSDRMLYWVENIERIRSVLGHRIKK